MTPNRVFSAAKLFYAHAGLFAFSEMIFLFSLPVLLWNQGFSLSFIFIFYALAAIPGYFFTTQVIRFILKYHIKFTMAMGVLFYILLGFITHLISPDNLWWAVALFLLAVQALFYFPARHLYFSEIISKKTIGFQAGVLNAVIAVARTIAPIIAGFIAISSELNTVFIFGAVIMIISILPVLLIPTEVVTKFDFIEFKKALKENPIFKKTHLAYVADGLNGILSYTAWPLLFYLFISQSDYFELGSLTTITYGVAAIMMVIVGHFFDRKYRKALLKASIFSSVTGVLGRFALLFFHPTLFVYAVQSFYLLSESALQSAFEGYWYSYSKATNTIFFTIHREMNLALGRFIMGVILAILSLFLTSAEELWPIFLLGIPVILMYLQKIKVDHHLE